VWVLGTYKNRTRPSVTTDTGAWLERKLEPRKNKNKKKKLKTPREARKDY
jgi:hypothetical protein